MAASQPNQELPGHTEAITHVSAPPTLPLQYFYQNVCHGSIKIFKRCIGFKRLKKGNTNPLSSGIHIRARKLQFLKPSTKKTPGYEFSLTVAVFHNYAKNSHRPLCQRGLISRFKNTKQLKIQNKFNCVGLHTTING